MNYFLPAINPQYTPSEEEQGYYKDIYEDIITQQIIISKLSTGISYSDTDNMDTLERILVYRKVMQMQQEENEAKMKAIQESKRK